MVKVRSLGVSVTSTEDLFDMFLDNPPVLEDDEGSNQNSNSQVDNTIPEEGQDQRTSFPDRRHGQRKSVSQKEEWEIEKIVGKRRTRRGYEYKVRWQDTWLVESEVANAVELMQRFEKEWLSRAATTPTAGEDRQR